MEEYAQREPSAHSIFRDSMSPKARKGKIAGGRRTRRSKKRGPTSFSFRGPGPATGLRLSWDPNDPVFPRRWVLSINDVVLQVTWIQPKELWAQMTQSHREQCIEVFEPTPIEDQEIRRKIMDEETRRMEFWEKVQRLGVKKHSHLRMGFSTDETKTITIRHGGKVPAYLRVRMGG